MTQAKTQIAPTTLAELCQRLEPARAAEAVELAQIFSDVTGFAPQIWTGGLVGFGRYEYTYDSGHSGWSLATGFAARKAEISIYIMPGYQDYAALLADLGKHRCGKSCLYLRRLSDAHLPTLRRLIRAGLDDLAKRWTITPS